MGGVVLVEMEPAPLEKALLGFERIFDFACCLKPEACDCF